MKKMLVVLALTLLLALVLAVPALAGAPYEGPYYPPDGVYVFAYGGAWETIADGAPVIIGVDEYGNPSGWNAPDTPIPRGSRISLAMGWIGFTRGLVTSTPQYLLNSVEFDGHDEFVTVAQGKLLWTPVYQPVLNPTPPPPTPFNENIGAKLYERDWYAFLGANLAPGRHSGQMLQVQPHITTDLMWSFDGQHAPVMYPPTPYTFDFSFIVQ
jgi:hypothetical protein